MFNIHAAENNTKQEETTPEDHSTDRNPPLVLKKLLALVQRLEVLIAFLVLECCSDVMCCLASFSTIIKDVN